MAGIFALFAAGKVISVNTQDAPEHFTAQQDSVRKASLNTAEQVFFADGSALSQDESLGSQIVAYAEKFIGIPYFYTGKSPSTGFDCSGFTSFIFKHFGYDVSPASKEQINAGRQIPLAAAKKGDLLIFTGTDKSIREPGHVGIVISKAGQKPVVFIHSSSNRHKWGVTTSTLAELSYSQRLLQVRRVIN